MVPESKEAGMMEIDELDIDIMRSLNNNARKSFRDIAKELQVSLTTVSNRVKAMERAGVIQGYMPMIDATKLG
ncbi:MAG: winged helix-turn-helix transcriptional regulator, partial [Thermoplasmata archaeon]|nr:winged helix-turn-helix transcriptional regulator [Thermoplasmata archaeon]